MGYLDGLWEDRIYDERGDIVKRDVITLTQEGEEITGQIQRIYPQDQARRRWNLMGKLLGNDFMAIFWSDLPDIRSHGCWHLRLTSESLFSGYYLKTDEEDISSTRPVRLDLVRLP
ncbi:MAG: hypothetical protein JSV00_07350 [bacterium]|nr:MAG: hypothetical protein JSV00_07350 [bacterium]